jgi:isopenicillin-N N-acyltransferase-like protein
MVLAARSSVGAHAPVVQASGTRFEIGYQHGCAVDDLVKGTLEWSFGELAVAGMSRDRALSGALRLLDIVRAHTPHLAEEVEGIAAGAGISVAEAAVINTRYELLFLDNARPYLVAPKGECTLFGVEAVRTRDGAPIIGQNVDLGPESRPFWIMLCVRPEGAPRILTATLAGMLAQEGVNSAGLALCGSMVRSRGWRSGYPSRKFLRRWVLEQPSVEAAIGIIRSAPPRASSHNLMLADSGGAIADIETTIDDVAVLRPVAGRLTHANHYLSPRTCGENGPMGEYVANSTARCDRMKLLLSLVEGSFTAREAVGLLQDHVGSARAICRHAERDEYGSETNVAVIAEPAKRCLHVAFGPPCESPFATYQLSDDGVTVGEFPDHGFTRGERFGKI